RLTLRRIRKNCDRMIDRAITDLRGWLDRDVAFNHMAVNAAAAEFCRDNFAGRVLEQLRRAEILTSCFQIEATESVFLGRGAEYVHRALALLSAQGEDSTRRFRHRLCIAAASQGFSGRS